MKQQRLKFA
ncbi:hypothetical protein F383_17393 [Gossypium arboreum]|uniref:Uncharacterized protein n=1 Tax=Gossypium arboreum TaxID=29729 RepID=A0A0B0NPB0_GOSAR|nr:hypothetical protein F383_17393 [Gossypium arboreum]